MSQRSPCQSQVSKWNNHNIIIMYYVRLWIFIIYLLGMLPGASLECLQIDAWTSPIVPELMFMAGMTLIRRKAATDREKRRRPKWRVCFELCSQAPVITIVWANSWCRRVRRSSLLKQAPSINPKAEFMEGVVCFPVLLVMLYYEERGKISCVSHVSLERSWQIWGRYTCIRL